MQKQQGGFSSKILCQGKENSQATNERKRLHGSGRKTLSVELEGRLLAWIHDMRLQ